MSLQNKTYLMSDPIRNPIIVRILTQIQSWRNNSNSLSPKLRKQNLSMAYPLNFFPDEYSRVEDELAQQLAVQLAQMHPLGSEEQVQCLLSCHTLAVGPLAQMPPGTHKRYWLYYVINGELPPPMIPSPPNTPPSTPPRTPPSRPRPRTSPRILPEVER